MKTDIISFAELKKIHGDNDNKIFDTLNLRAKVEGNYKGYLIFYPDCLESAYKICFNDEELFFVVNYIIKHKTKSHSQIKILKLNDSERVDNYLFYNDESLDVLGE
jgi:hypothetical protein